MTQANDLLALMSPDPPPRAKRVNSRAKGSGFERTVATELRAWLGEDWKIARNPNDRQKGQVKDSSGEFTFDGPGEFPFCVECKAHESFDYGQLFRDPVSGPFPKFWKQAVKQAQIVRLRPLLILKRNLGEVLVAGRQSDFVQVVRPSARYCRLQVRIDMTGLAGWNGVIEHVEIVPFAVLIASGPGLVAELLPPPPGVRR